jgi:predicted DNA-binding WGR domain protein
VRRWEFNSAGSAKFWESAADGPAVTVCYGRIGTAGQTQTKEFGTGAQAAAYFAKAVAEKEKKGYQEVEVAVGAAQAGTQGSDVERPAEPAKSAEPLESPDEDTMVIPASWRRILYPRRGGVPGPAVKLQPGTWEQDGAVFVYVDGRVPVPRGDTKVEDGQYCGATSQQAAALALRILPRYDHKLWVFVDTWVQERGIAFAAAATVFLGSSDGSYGSVQTRRETFPRMRKILAAASDADYAEAVRALAEVRHTFTARLIASFLVPTETAWADEVCAEYKPGTHHQFDQLLLTCVLSTPEQLAVVGPANLLNNYYTGLADLETFAEGLGIAAVPAFAEVVSNGTYISTDTRRATMSVLAQLPCDEAIEILAKRLDEKYVSGAMLEAMGRFPVRALRLLATVANSGTKSAPIARTLLAGHVRVHAGLVDDVLPGLPERDANLISALAQEAVGRPEASADALPPLLVAPPWTRHRAKRAAPKVLALEPPPLSQVDWLPGEREAWVGDNPYRPRGIDWEKRAEQHAANGFAHDWEAMEFFVQAPELLARPLLAGWEPDLRYWYMFEALGVVIARFELDAFALAVNVGRAVNPGSGGQVLQPLVDRTVARLMADWFTRLKSGRAHAVSWLSRHAESAALLLIPDAVGAAGPQRVAAENALRFLAPLTDVRAAAESYGPQAAEAVTEIVGSDPLELHPQRMPAFPAWLQGAYLPQILLRGREYALPAESARQVLSMLAISKPDEPYAGIAVVCELADPTSLAEFVWALFAAWQAVEMPSKESWVLTALGWFGDDDTARRLAPMIRAWPGEGGHQRAVAGLDVLSALGTDVALMQLNQISQKVKFKALKLRAQEKIAEIARNLDLTADQLGDRLVPDFGLDAEGGLWLDYGPRRFRVGFDEQLKPVVAEEAGARRKDLPASNAKDDAELAAAARKHFGGLKKDVRNVATEVIRRLESAMVSGRTWSAVEFRELLLEHPLVWHITRRLVWLSGDEGARTAFRVAEDRTLATVEDEEFGLAEQARIGLAHPLTLGDELAAWAEVFADYEILQPFTQLGRPVYALTEQELPERRLARFEGTVVPVGLVLGMSHRGWQRAAPEDAGIQGNIFRQLGEKLYLIIDLEPGIVVGLVNELGDQTLRAVYLSAHQNGYWGKPGENGPRLSDLDPVMASELVGDLTHLTS